MTVTDTPDWVNPLPGGSHLILNAGFNLFSGGGVYTSPWIDVTAFNGLYLETNGFALSTSFGTLEVQFQDAAGVQPILAKYDAVWRGDLRAKLNVPVLGAQARIVITGPPDNANAQIIVVGHGGGGAAGQRVAMPQLANFWGVSLVSGGFSVITPPIICEGPGHLVALSGGQPTRIQVQAYTSGGSSQPVLASLDVAANSSGMASLWVPPQPLLVQINNSGAATGTVYGGLWLGRP